jgi:hypothetical protein
MTHRGCKTGHSVPGAGRRDSQSVHSSRFCRYSAREMGEAGGGLSGVVHPGHDREAVRANGYSDVSTEPGIADPSGDARVTARACDVSNHR